MGGLEPRNLRIEIFPNFPEDFLAPGLRLAAELKFKMAAYDNITRNDKVSNLYSFFYDVVGCESPL